MLRIAINAANLVKGGGIQVGASLVHYALAEPTIVALPLVSKEVFDQLSPDDQHAVGRSIGNPSKSLRNRRRLRRAIAANQVDATWTIFGPSFTRLPSPEIAGFANPWVTHATRTEYFDVYPQASRRLLARARHAMLRRAICKSSALIFETEYSRRSFCKRTGYSTSKTVVIPNAVSPHFKQPYDTDHSLVETIDHHAPRPCYRILCLSAYYPHKNLKILPQVALALQTICPDLKFTVLTTLPRDDYNDLISSSRPGSRRFLANLGPLDMHSVPTAYLHCDLAILPTFIETYSAVFAECSAIGRHLVTSDRECLRDIAPPNTLHADPRSPESFAQAIATSLNLPPAQPASIPALTAKVRFDLALRYIQQCLVSTNEQ